MVPIASLWLAIVLSAITVFVVSAAVWMSLPHHKSDFLGLPDEASAATVLRAQNLSPAVYNIPHVKSQNEMAAPEVQARFVDGPVAFLTVLPDGVPRMGKRMVQSFLYYLAVGVMVAYMVTRTMDPGASYLSVFRVAGTVAWLAYSFGQFPDAIWFGKPWSHVWKQAADGLLYALLTAGIFGWQWVRVTGGM